MIAPGRAQGYICNTFLVIGGIVSKVLTVLLAAFAATGGAFAQAQEVVTIGHSAPLTGPQAVNGKDNENGAMLAVDELNKQGVVVAGKKVTFKLDSEDDQRPIPR